MLQPTLTRSALKLVLRSQAARLSYNSAPFKFRNQLNDRRPQALSSLPRVTTTSLYATKLPQEPVNKIDKDAERKYAQQKLESHPEEVSTESSVRRAFEGSGKSGHEGQTMGSIKNDIRTIKDTFGLKEVPREPLYLGIAGALPYAATSLTTVFLAYDLKHVNSTGRELFFSPETAHYLLDAMVPIQIGYGAVIISFLGAIHWGLEYAGYGGHHGYRRYLYGVIAPAVAWPTLLISPEIALTTQFLAFVLQYFADARATVRGWCPPWYSTYRFVLTFMVGASLVLGLIGRGQLAQSNVRIKHSAQQADADHDAQWQALERKEMHERAAAAAATAETDNEEENEGKGKDDKKPNKNEK